MKYEQAGFVKFTNKLFPKWYGEGWLVQTGKNVWTRFRRFEEAAIYEELIKIKKKLRIL